MQHIIFLRFARNVENCYTADGKVPHLQSAAAPETYTLYEIVHRTDCEDCDHDDGARYWKGMSKLPRSKTGDARKVHT